MSEKNSDDTAFWDELFREIDERQAKKKWDREHTYVVDIIRILHGRKFGVRKADLDDALLQKRRTDGEPIPQKFAETTQSVLNTYTSQSLVFQSAKRSPDDNLFYSPRGKGSGTWALHTERAKMWLKRKLALEL